MKKSVKQGIVGALIAVVAFGGAMAVLGRDGKDEKTLKSWDYEIARLDDSTGKKDTDDKSGIVTKNFYKFEDLKEIELEEGYTYYINAYDEDKQFLQVDQYGSDYVYDDSYEAIGGKYFKIEIVDNEDDEISLLEKGAVAKGVTVTLTTETESEDE